MLAGTLNVRSSLKQNAKISAIEIRTSSTIPSLYQPYTVDFGTNANGKALKGGQYVSSHWASLGMIVYDWWYRE